MKVNETQVKNCSTCTNAKLNHPRGLTCDAVHKGKTTIISDWRFVCKEWKEKEIEVELLNECELQDIEVEIVEAVSEVVEKECQEWKEDTEQSEVFTNEEIKCVPDCNNYFRGTCLLYDITDCDNPKNTECEGYQEGKDDE